MHLDLNADEGPEDFALPVEVRVKAGMALLDEKHGPEWVRRIDVDTLDVAIPCRCVIGQVYGGVGHYGPGCDDMGLDEETEVGHGFEKGDGAEYPELTTAWRSAILARRLELGQAPC